MTVEQGQESTCAISYRLLFIVVNIGFTAFQVYCRRVKWSLEWAVFGEVVQTLVSIAGRQTA